jgi:hypothetical protein
MTYIGKIDQRNLSMITTVRLIVGCRRGETDGEDGSKASWGWWIVGPGSILRTCSGKCMKERRKDFYRLLR